MSRKCEKTKPTVDFSDDYPVFTPAMKREYLILVPDMLPWHFDLLTEVIREEGYMIEVLHNEGRQVIDEGLKHVHNDTCYPALCVIGQYLDALKSGKYDVNKTAVLITQTGGGCRGTGKGQRIAAYGRRSSAVCVCDLLRRSDHELFQSDEAVRAARGGQRRGARALRVRASQRVARSDVQEIQAQRKNDFGYVCRRPRSE